VIVLDCFGLLEHVDDSVDWGVHGRDNWDAGRTDWKIDVCSENVGSELRFYYFANHLFFFFVFFGDRVDDGIVIDENNRIVWRNDIIEWFVYLFPLRRQLYSLLSNLLVS
jgi:hypothetical protein